MNKQITKVLIFNPSMRMGGTVNLLANLARILSVEDEIDLFYAEYQNGASKPFLQDCNLTYIDVEDSKKIDISGTLVIGILLHVKLINRVFITNSSTRFIFWSTHPDDGIKILPAFNLFYKLRRPCKKRVAELLHPLSKKKIKRFLEYGMEKRGIVWMDKHNFEENKFFYNLTSHPIVWPLITSQPKLGKELEKNLGWRKINIGVLGRLCDFKVLPLFGLFPPLDKISHKIKVSFVGDGGYHDNLINELRKHQFEFEIVGTVAKSELDEYLLNFDIIIGMGTSVLEGAKLMVPSIVIDGSYFPVAPDKLKLRWLFDCPRYYVGELKSPGDRYVGQNIITLIEQFESDKVGIGSRCFDHWLNFHSENALKVLALQQIKENQFYFTAKIKNYVSFGVFGRTINLLKQHLHKL